MKLEHRTAAGCFNEPSTNNPAALADTYARITNISSSIYCVAGLFSSKASHCRCHHLRLCYSADNQDLTFILPPVIVTMNSGHQDNGRATIGMWGKLDAWVMHLSEVYSVLAATYSVMMSQGLTVQSSVRCLPVTDARY